METQEDLSIGHAMQRASALFGYDRRAAIIAACVQTAGQDYHKIDPGIHVESAAQVVAEDARDLFIEVVKAFTPGEQ